MKIYNDPGRGRKQCECGIYCHVRCSHCPKCNFIFNAEVFERKENKIVEPTKQESGRGRKQCLCGKYCGVKCKFCPFCGKSFTKEEQTKPIEHPQTEYLNKLGYEFQTVIYTPSGVPPKAPKSLEKNDVFQWINDNLVNTSGILFPSAFKYYCNRIYKDKEQVKKAHSIIDDWYSNLMNND